MFWLWWTRGRGPAREAIAVQYEPPDKLTPGECGTLVDNEAAMRDITATLVDLAVKGYLTIEQKDESHLLGLSHSKEYIFHLKNPPAEWATLARTNQQMLAALFDSGASTDVKLSDLQNHFYTQLPGDSRPHLRRADGRQLLSAPPGHGSPRILRRGIRHRIFIGGGERFLARATGIASRSPGSLPASHPAWSSAFSAGSCPRARSPGSALSKKFWASRISSGARRKIKSIACKRDSRLFEKFLPYAMALHVEKKWVQAFSGIAHAAAHLVSGPYGSGFMPYLFVNDLNMMSTQAGSTMASSPRSSGGSGFGGGGVSGGGFGGGGGGGF